MIRLFCTSDYLVTLNDIYTFKFMVIYLFINNCIY